MKTLLVRLLLLAGMWSCSCCHTPAPAAPAPLARRARAGDSPMVGRWDVMWNSTTWKYTFSGDGKCESSAPVWKGEWRLEGRRLYITETSNIHTLIWSCDLHGTEAMIHHSSYSSDVDKRIPCTIVRTE